MWELAEQRVGGGVRVESPATSPPHKEQLTIQVIGGVEGVQRLLAPLHEGVLLALGHALEQPEQLLFFFCLLVQPPAQRAACRENTKAP